MGLFNLVGGVEVRERPKRHRGEPSYKRLDFVRPKDPIEDYEIIRRVRRERVLRTGSEGNAANEDDIVDVVAGPAEPEPVRLTFEQWQHHTVQLRRQQHASALREEQRRFQQEQERRRIQDEQDLYWRIQAEQAQHPHHQGPHPHHNQNQIPPPPPFAPHVAGAHAPNGQHGHHPGGRRGHVPPHGQPNAPRPAIEPRPEIIQIFSDDEGSDDEAFVEIRPRGGYGHHGRHREPSVIFEPVDPDEVYTDSSDEEPRARFSRSRSRNSRRHRG